MSIRISSCITFVMPNGEQLRWYSNVMNAMEADGETEIMTRERVEELLSNAMPFAVSVIFASTGWSQSNDDKTTCRT